MAQLAHPRQRVRQHLALAGGQCLVRLLELGPHLIARELPLLLAPGGDAYAPVGHIAGAVDLVYRDPVTGEVVVADYKTDDVPDDAAIAERARAYKLQGAVYVQGVREALALPAVPRFELWFLHADRIVPVG